MDSFYCHNTEYFKMQMVINLAPVSLSNKKVNFYLCLRVTFLKTNATENAKKSIPEPLDLKIILRGACPQTPLAARAFGARDLPHLALKSGYGSAFSSDSVVQQKWWFLELFSRFRRGTENRGFIPNQKIFSQKYFK